MTASQPVPYEAFHVCEKLTTNFHKTGKSGEEDYSTELCIR